MSELRPKTGIQQIKAHMLTSSAADLPPVRIALDSNESAFGPCQAATDAARAAASRLHRYLENPAALLGPALAQRHGLEVDRIAIGNGSDDLLARLARVYLDSGNEMIRSRNGYLKTPNYAHANNATPVSVDDHAFTTSVDAVLDAVNDKTRMVYIANPDNPSGTCLDGAEIRRLHRSLPGRVILVLDCAYEEYVDAPGYEPGQRLAGEADNVVMTRTFSKIHGLAGARIGWMYASREIIDMVGRIGLTFPLASTSVAAALAAIQDDSHVKRVFAINRRLRDAFSRHMAEIGLKVYPSQTNFVLLEFEPGEKSAANCAQFLARRGISVRRFASAAFDDCVRVTIGLESEMQAVTRGIAEFMQRAP